MKRLGFVTGLCVASALTVAWPHAQETGRGGGRRGGTPNWQYGSVAPLVPDARGWGWQTKAYVSENAQRPFYNLAKENLLQAGHELHDLLFQSRALLRGQHTFRLRLVRDAAQHDVV